MNQIDAGALAQVVLTILAKKSLDKEECLQVAALMLSPEGTEALKNTKAFKALVDKADLT